MLILGLITMEDGLEIEKKINEINNLAKVDIALIIIAVILVICILS